MQIQYEPIARLTEQDFQRVRIDMLRDLTGFRRDEVLDETPAPMSGPAAVGSLDGADWRNRSPKLTRGSKSSREIET